MKVWSNVEIRMMKKCGIFFPTNFPEIGKVRNLHNLFFIMCDFCTIPLSRKLNKNTNFIKLMLIASNFLRWKNSYWFKNHSNSISDIGWGTEEALFAWKKTFIFAKLSPSSNSNFSWGWVGYNITHTPTQTPPIQKSMKY